MKSPAIFFNKNRKVYSLFFRFAKSVQVFVNINVFSFKFILHDESWMLERNDLFEKMMLFI